VTEGHLLSQQQYLSRVGHSPTHGKSLSFIPGSPQGVLWVCPTWESLVLGTHCVGPCQQAESSLDVRGMTAMGLCSPPSITNPTRQSAAAYR